MFTYIQKVIEVSSFQFVKKVSSDFWNLSKSKEYTLFDFLRVYKTIGVDFLYELIHSGVCWKAFCIFYINFNPPTKRSFPIVNTPRQYELAASTVTSPLWCQVSDKLVEKWERNQDADRIHPILVNGGLQPKINLAIWLTKYKNS